MKMRENPQSARNFFLPIFHPPLLTRFIQHSSNGRVAYRETAELRQRFIELFVVLTVNPLSSAHSGPVFFVRFQAVNEVNHIVFKVMFSFLKKQTKITRDI